jgi:hypothetical protein
MDVEIDESRGHHHALGIEDVVEVSLVFIGFGDQFDQPVADDDVASRLQPLRRIDDSAISNHK